VSYTVKVGDPVKSENINCRYPSLQQLTQLQLTTDSTDLTEPRPHYG